MKRFVAKKQTEEMKSILKIFQSEAKQLVATMKEPIPGWTDNIFGPAGAVIGYASGVIKTGVNNNSVSQDIVPVDLVINSIIAAAYIVGISLDIDINAIPNFWDLDKIEAWRAFIRRSRQLLTNGPLVRHCGGSLPICCPGDRADKLMCLYGP
ncbi:unnamed protein product [Timema podura]|uniref:Fatty acyl-CoA reductase n=1 Tax=Timema podura TaxID=61482 RepID=A0ABN7NS95_TIMPD|nr:unnamed protein product [Timema podura]